MGWRAAELAAAGPRRRDAIGDGPKGKRNWAGPPGSGAADRDSERPRAPSPNLKARAMARHDSERGAGARPSRDRPGDRGGPAGAGGPWRVAFCAASVYTPGKRERGVCSTALSTLTTCHVPLHTRHVTCRCTRDLSRAAAHATCHVPLHTRPVTCRCTRDRSRAAAHATCHVPLHTRPVTCRCTRDRH